MSKDKFSWKGLFINEETSDEKTTPEVTDFPTENKFPTPSQNVTASEHATTNPYLDEIYQVYEKGFEGLNHEGFDFFELYKSVVAVGATNPQSYQMAFTMGKSLNPALTKEFLLEKSKFYIQEIEGVHTKYNTTGLSKRNDLVASVTNEKQKLSKNISELEAKIQQLQSELMKSKSDLEQIDFNNKQEFDELDLKISANAVAKNKILESINTVVKGINQYL
nr:hypothetical protein [uncultured Flavobacterium sp.]